MAISSSHCPDSSGAFDVGVTPQMRMTLSRVVCPARLPIAVTVEKNTSRKREALLGERCVRRDSLGVTLEPMRGTSRAFNTQTVQSSLLILGRNDRLG